MSSWRSPNSGPLHTTQEQNGPRAKCDQVVFEAIAKAAEIVVASRCWIENTPGGNSSIRFNLSVPEVHGVRSILQRWKRALHVPLRLDVYYQHEDSRRELLERWCLEYAPKTTYSFQHASADPIIQLRQVCKQIVIWLRTLYGWSRMLPAQALRQRRNSGNDNHVGFSIYVVSEGNDDVTGLVHKQGFSSQGQPHSVLTPYGELGWKVFYAPKNIIQRLIPVSPPYAKSQATNSTTPKNKIKGRATSQPIPMNNNASNGNASPWSENNKREEARSAPMHQRSPVYHRSNSDVGGSVPRHPPLMSSPMRSNSGLPDYPEHSITDSSFVPSNSGETKPPIKNLSALSLAMMMNDESLKKATGDANGEGDDAAEKRRAALHHAPPQFNTNSSPAAASPVLKPNNLAAAGEYGYGYNNHLPNMKALSATMARTSNDAAARSASPGPVTPLSSTPPGYLLATGPTPPNSVPPPSALIPPRSSVTPPFVRPAGFVGEPPSQLLPPAAAAPATETPAASEISLNHQTSLDLLHSSPFQQPASVFSISNGNATENHGERRQLFNLSDLRPSPGGGLLDPRYRPDDMYYDQAFADDDDDNNMPFAVDSYAGSSLTAPATSSSENPLSSSAIVASFCTAPPKRLALFDNHSNKYNAASSHDNTTEDPNKAQDGMMGSLADQLAEFKTFGASLMMGSEASSSTSTPIPLRT